MFDKRKYAEKRKKIYKLKLRFMKTLQINVLEPNENEKWSQDEDSIKEFIHNINFFKININKPISGSRYSLLHRFIEDAYWIDEDGEFEYDIEQYENILKILLYNNADPNKKELYQDLFTSDEYISPLESLFHKLQGEILGITYRNEQELEEILDEGESIRLSVLNLEEVDEYSHYYIFNKLLLDYGAIVTKNLLKKYRGLINKIEESYTLNEVEIYGNDDIDSSDDEEDSSDDEEDSSDEERDEERGDETKQWRLQNSRDHIKFVENILELLTSYYYKKYVSGSRDMNQIVPMSEGDSTHIARLDVMAKNVLKDVLKDAKMRRDNVPITDITEKVQMRLINELPLSKNLKTWVMSDEGYEKIEDAVHYLRTSGKKFLKFKFF